MNFLILSFYIPQQFPYPGSIPGFKHLGREVNHSFLSNAEVGISGAIPSLPCAFMFWTGRLYLYFYLLINRVRVVYGLFVMHRIASSLVPVCLSVCLSLCLAVQT
jgi:hypothetical protein